MMKTLATLLLFLLPFTVLAQSEQPCSSTVQFEIECSIWPTVQGCFEEVSTNVNFQEDDLTTSYARVSARVSSVNTQQKVVDKLLLSEEYFDAASFPLITFSSNSFQKVGDKILVTGKLRIKATEKIVTIPFSKEVIKGQTVFNGKFTIKRTDFEVGKRSMLVGEEVDIKFSFAQGLTAADSVISVR